MKKKIFIVEDEEMLSKVLAEQFSVAGFDVEIASDGEKALELLEKSKPDIILLDIILPKINGFDVLKSIKENPDTQDIPVIMTSNLGNEIIKEYSIGFTDTTDEKKTADIRTDEMKEKIDHILKDHFKLEFLNRLDEIVIFKSLSKEVLAKIVDLELSKVEKRLENKVINLKIASRVKKMLMEKGYDLTYGARPLKRIIQSMILDELAMEIIEGKIKAGDKVEIDLSLKDKILMTVK